MVLCRLIHSLFHGTVSFFSTQEKDKKKGKNKRAGKENSAQDGKQKRLENKPNEAAISSIQTVTEAASDNKSKDKGNSSDTKPDVLGKTRKYEGMVCVTVERSPRKLPPIEPNKKTTSMSKAKEPKRKSQSERAKAKELKRKSQSERAKAKEPKRKEACTGSQMIPNRK